MKVLVGNKEHIKVFFLEGWGMGGGGGGGRERLLLLMLLFFLPYFEVFFSLFEPRADLGIGKSP